MNENYHALKAPGKLVVFIFCQAADCKYVGEVDMDVYKEDKLKGRPILCAKCGKPTDDVRGAWKAGKQ